MITYECNFGKCIGTLGYNTHQYNTCFNLPKNAKTEISGVRPLARYDIL